LSSIIGVGIGIGIAIGFHIAAASRFPVSIATPMNLALAVLMILD
jgi:hypothetical protein